MKTILHLDMDSYFASVEQMDNFKLRGKPVGVCGKPNSRTVVSAASIEAKKYGVKSGMPTWQAKKLCPSIMLVPAHFHRYQELSRRVFGLLENYSPLLEIFSIDEAFLDITHRRDDPILLALEIKARVREEVGGYLSCSIGLAPNKLLAKLASGLEKPDGLTVLLEKEKIKQTLEKINLKQLCGIGSQILRRLNQLGIYTTRQLANFDENILRREFGIYGKTLKLMGEGRDNSKVVPYFEMPAEKSMGHMYTLPADIYTLDEAKKVIYKLCEQVGERLRKKGMAGRTVAITLRFNDFTHFHKQYSLSRYINSGMDIYQVTESIIEKLKSKNEKPQLKSKNFLKPIRMVGVVVSNLINVQDQPLSLLAADQKQENLTQQIDKINQKFGEFTVAPVPAFVTNLFYAPDGRTKRFYT